MEVLSASPSSPIEASAVQGSSQVTTPTTSSPSPISDSIALSHAESVGKVDYQRQGTPEENSPVVDSGTEGDEMTSTSSSSSATSIGSKIKVKSEPEETCENRLGSVVRVKTEEGAVARQSSATSKGKESPCSVVNYQRVNHIAVDYVLHKGKILECFWFVEPAIADCSILITFRPGDFF
jgi:hypothetical protein